MCWKEENKSWLVTLLSFLSFVVYSSFPSPSAVCLSTQEIEVPPDRALSFETAEAPSASNANGTISPSLSRSLGDTTVTSSPTAKAAAAEQRAEEASALEKNADDVRSQS